MMTGLPVTLKGLQAMYSIRRSSSLPFANQSIAHVLHVFMLLVFAMILTACGGGGSSTTVSQQADAIPPTITSISPASGAATGGTLVTITGLNFSGATGVSFDGNPGTSFKVVSATQITVVTPVGFAGDKRVVVANASGVGLSSSLFTYIAGPDAARITAVSPSNGSAAGGTTVTLTGVNFTGATGVTFNGVAATSFTVDSDKQITVTSPAGSVGAISIVVQSPNGSASATNIYTYVTPPSTAPAISSVSPSSGGTAGGTSITINGQNFTGATGVTIDGVAATALVVNSNTQITVTTPAGTAGAKTVAVTSPLGTGTLLSGFTYSVLLPAPTITGVAPASGATAGGTSVVITGTNFTGATSVKIGGVSSSFTVNSITQITVSTYSSTAGAKDVVVTTPSGSATSVGAFTYIASPISTFAGTTAGYTGDGAVSTAAQLSGPRQIAFDSNGNLYFADTGNHVIRVLCKVTGTYFGLSMNSGNVYTVAGSTAGLSGDGGGPRLAQLSSPEGVAFDSSGNLYIADTGNHRIRVISKTGGTLFGFVGMAADNIYTLVGSTAGLSGDAGAAFPAQLSSPKGVAFDSAGNFYIADSGNHRIRVVLKSNTAVFGVGTTADNIYTVAGTTAGLSGDAAAATSAQLDSPLKIAFDGGGNLNIVDSGNSRIRVVAKNSGNYFGVIGMAANNIYTVAGSTAGFSGDGTAAQPTAQLNLPTDMAFDSAGNMYIADANNNRIRVVAKTTATTYGVSMTANSIYTIVGMGVAGLSGDGATATAAQINGPRGIALDSSGYLYIGDSANNRIRLVAP